MCRKVFHLVCPGFTPTLPTYVPDSFSFRTMRCRWQAEDLNERSGRLSFQPWHFMANPCHPSNPGVLCKSSYSSRHFVSRGEDFHRVISSLVQEPVLKKVTCPSFGPVLVSGTLHRVEKSEKSTVANRSGVDVPIEVLPERSKRWPGPPRIWICHTSHTR